MFAFDVDVEKGMALTLIGVNFELDCVTLLLFEVIVKVVVLSAIADFETPTALKEIVRVIVFGGFEFDAPNESTLVGVGALIVVMY